MKVRSSGEKAFNYFNILVLLALVALTMGPLWISMVGSFNEGLDYTRGGVYFWPRKFSLLNYRIIFSDETILNAYYVSIARTLIGTAICVIFTSVVAYAMSAQRLKFKGVYVIIMLVTMFFSGGIIPSYLLIKQLGLLDNFGVYIIPGIFNVFYMIIIQNSFREIPNSVSESAKIDGAGEYRILFSLYLPMSLPVIAAVSLFVAVGHWNSYFDSMMYTTSDTLQTVQLFLQKMLAKTMFAANAANSAAAAIPEERRTISAQTIILATMIATTMPILFVYPFVQKHIIKGIMIGSIKG